MQNVKPFNSNRAETFKRREFNILIVGVQRCANNDLTGQSRMEGLHFTLPYDWQIDATNVLHMLNCAAICYETWNPPRPQDSGWNTQLKMAACPQTQGMKLLQALRM